MTTSCIVSFGKNALAIKDDAAFTLADADLQPFSDLDDLKTRNNETYATYEPDYWLLDGKYKFLPSSGAHVGLMTQDMSDASGAFAGPPFLEILFDEDHSTDKLTLYFSQHSDDYASEITVTFRDSGNFILHSDTYFPNSAQFEVNETVVDFRKIEIALDVSNKAFRYARLTGIDFDELITFTGSEVQAARVVEQINPISLELPFNELELTLFSSEGDFSIVDPAGFYANLQFREPLEVHEQVDNDLLFIGRFYLDKWESKSENIADFQASDAIAFLDKLNFLGDLDLSGSLDSQDHFAALFEDTNIDYELDASLSGVDIKGWFPFVPRREILQHMGFRLGAYITCARSNKVRILPSVLADDANPILHTISRAQKGINSPVELRPLVTGVDVLEHIYTHDNAAGPNVGRVFFDGNISVGEHIIFFDVLCQTKDITGTASITIISGYTGTSLFNNNFLRFDCTVAGTLKIEYSSGFIHTTNAHSVTHPSDATPNVIRIERAYLITADSVEDALDRVDAYYQQRYIQKTRLFATRIKPGDKVLIDTQKNKQIVGIVERMETDLAGGFISDVEIVGVIQE